MLSFALTILGYGRIAANAVGAWLSRRSLAELACIALVAFALVQHFQLNDARHDRDAWHRQYDAEHAGRVADRESYRKAQADAAQANKAHVAQIEQQYQRNSDDERQAYLRDHAELVRLRNQHATPSGAPGSAGPSPSPAPSGGADGDELHLSADEHLQASEIELRLLHLQNWVLKQLNVNPNTEAAH
jgi:hypothetical protein